MNTTYKAYVINLKTEIARREFMMKQSKDIGIQFIFQEAIDGRTHEFVGVDMPTFFSNEKEKKIKLAEKGCALSHRIVLEKFLADKNTDYALIMEDDIELPRNFKEIIEHEIKQRNLGKTRWEYLSFNYPTVGFHFIRLWLFLFGRMFKQQKKSKYIKLPLYAIKFLIVCIMTSLERIREIVYVNIFTYGKPSLFYRPLYLAGCYLINRSGAEKLVALNHKLQYTADRLPNIARIKKALKYYAFVPLLVKQRRHHFGSNITDSVDDSFEF